MVSKVDVQCARVSNGQEDRSNQSLGQKQNNENLFKIRQGNLILKESKLRTRDQEMCSIKGVLQT